MNLLGMLLQIIASMLLTLIPAISLKNKRMNITMFFCFVSLMSSFIAGGLIIALPVSLVLLLYFLWLDFVAKGKTFLFGATFVLQLYG